MARLATLQRLKEQAVKTNRPDMLRSVEELILLEVELLRTRRHDSDARAHEE